MSAEPARSISLPKDVTAPRVARSFVRDELARSSIPEELVDTVELLVSEIVTNCLLHAHSTSTLSLVEGRGGTRVEVCDHSVAEPTPRPPDPESSSGRGLLLVEALSSAWGYHVVPGDGKCVWFEVKA